ncbi:MAG: hypothetical protein NTX91_05005 [candidate division SR1 bacterium]|nr:hypothetical protein [candidate division SR1 bacterium]
MSNHYYENINGEVKKVEKTFTDKKKYDEFMKKSPMPTLGSLFGVGPVKKALPVKKSCCGSCKTKKPTPKKKK